MKTEDKYKFLLLRWIYKKRRYYDFAEKKDVKKNLYKYKNTKEPGIETIEKDYTDFFENFDNNIFNYIYHLDESEDKIKCNLIGGFFVSCLQNGLYLPIMLYDKVYREKENGWWQDKLTTCIIEIARQLVEKGEHTSFRSEQEKFLDRINIINGVLKVELTDTKVKVKKHVTYWITVAFCGIIFLSVVWNIMRGNNFTLLVFLFSLLLYLIKIIKERHREFYTEKILALNQEKLQKSLEIIIKKRRYQYKRIFPYKEYSFHKINESITNKEDKKTDIVKKNIMLFIKKHKIVVFVIIGLCILWSKQYLTGIRKDTNGYGVKEKEDDSISVIAPQNNSKGKENSIQENEIENIKYRIAAARAHIRERHSASSRSIDILQKGTEVEILDIYDDGKRNIWYQVQYGEEGTGWVNRKVLQPEVKNALSITSVKTITGIDVAFLYDGYIETNWPVSMDMIDYYSRIYVKLGEKSNISGLILYNGNYRSRDFDLYGKVSKIEVRANGQEKGYDYRVDTKYNLDGAKIIFKEVLQADEIIITIKEIEQGESTDPMIGTPNIACLGDIVVLGV